MTHEIPIEIIKKATLLEARLRTAGIPMHNIIMGDVGLGRQHVMVGLIGNITVLLPITAGEGTMQLTSPISLGVGPSLNYTL